MARHGPGAQGPLTRPFGPNTPFWVAAPGAPAPPALPLGLLPPPSVPVFPPGYQPGPADFGLWVQQSLGFCVQKICFRAHQSLPQNPGSGASTLVLDVVDEDPCGGWVAGPSNRWIPPYTGLYEVGVTVVPTAGAVWLSAAMSVSGGQRYDGNSVLTTSGNTGGATASQYVALIGGQDYVTPMAFASAGFTTEVLVPGRCSSMEIVFLSE